MVMRKYTHILIAGLVLLSFVSNSFGQDDNGIKPITKSGSAAFIFSLSGFGTFGLDGPVLSGVGAGDSNNSNGYVFHTGAKCYIADELALRLLLSLSMDDNGSDDAPEKSTEIGIGVGIEHHLPAVYAISPYIGGEITFVSSSITTQIFEDITNQTQQPQATGTEISGTGIVIAAIAGFDWFPWKALALGAEYSLGFQTSSGTSKDLLTGTETELGTQTAIGFGGAANIHAIVYF